MNNQFSYELDERHIRILMQDAEVPYHESAWKRFEAISTNEIKANTSFTSHIPKFNLSISRSIIVPIVFVFFIGCLSAILFSFVDFKKKEEAIKEKPASVNLPKITKKEILKPVMTVKAKTKQALPVATASVVNTQSIAVKPEIEKITVPGPIKHEVTATKPIEKTSVADTKTQITASMQTSTVNMPVKRMRRKVLQQPEELPIINASPRAATPVEEPELELK